MYKLPRLIFIPFKDILYPSTQLDKTELCDILLIVYVKDSCINVIDRGDDSWDNSAPLILTTLLTTPGPMSRILINVSQ